MSAEMVFWFDWWINCMALRHVACRQWARVKQIMVADWMEQGALQAGGWPVTWPPS